MSIYRTQQCTICSMKIHGSNEYLHHIRKVHGSDRSFGTQCPLCESKFIYTNVKSFIHHLREHASRSVYVQESSSYLSSYHDENVRVDVNEDEEAQTPMTIEKQNFLEEIKFFYVKMLLKMREGHVLPGHVMKTIASSITGLFQLYSDCLSSNCHVNMNNTISSRLNDEIEKSLFDISRNEESFISSCRLYFKFVKPKEILLTTGKKAYYIPLRELLMVLFEKKELYDCVKKEKKFVAQFNHQDIIYHYRNGEIGQRHRVLSRKGDCILLQLYSDDLGVINPLMGKNAMHKLTTFYFSIDDLPAQKNASLSAVYLLLLYYRKDFEDPNNRRILFRELKQDLASLEDDGLVLPGDDEPTYFTISTLCADNLAAHELGGFTCSFNTGRCCRYCLIHHKEMKNTYKESQLIIRTSASHDSHVRHIQQVPANKYMYGINEQSALSILPSFHPIDCLPPDIMHDVLEGIMPKLISCLLHTIMSTRLCVATRICQRLNHFEYGRNDRRNRPPVLKERDIFDRRISGKAVEKYCLFINLPFMFIDLIDSIPYWFLYELLREIWDIVYSDYPRKSWLSTLEELVQEFVQLFQTIFPDQFTPKFHFLLHTARNIAKYGPLKRQMNIRYEAKHHLLKKIANRCNNFINLPYTISRRVQLRQCYELTDTIVYGINGISGKFRKRQMKSFRRSIQQALIDDSSFSYDECIDCVKWVKLNDVQYKIGDYFVSHLLGGEEIPLSVEIKHIIHIDDDWRFVVHCYDTLSFKKNLWCFEISPSNIYAVFGHYQFVTHKAADCYLIDSTRFIRSPYRLTLIQ